MSDRQPSEHTRFNSDVDKAAGVQPLVCIKSNLEIPKRIAIIGGGLTGLAAAHRLGELALDNKTPVETTLFESGSRLGGLIGTQQIGEYLVDVGADSFLTNKPAAVNLCRRLGIEDRLIPTDTRFRGALVLRNGRPIPVPRGFQLLSPTEIWPVLTSPIFSISGKLRMLMEWFIPGKKSASTANSPAGSRVDHSELIDESLSGFVRRRFGREALDRLIQPLVGGIYTADPERLSLAATLPRFLEMERDFGSIIRASRHLQKAEREQLAANLEPASATDRNSGPRDQSSGARYGLFAGLKGGMDELVDALRNRINSGCIIRLNTEVASISAIGRSDDSAQKPVSHRYNLTFADGHQEQFDTVIIATTGDRVAGILESLDARLSQELRKIDYASSAIVVSGHRLADIGNPLQSFGMVIPHIENRRILAVSFSSRKFPDRAPADRVLLRTFVGGAMQPELLQQSDENLIRIVRDELSETLGVGGEPDFVRVFRYQRAMPQYHVGHLELVARIEALLRRHPRLTLAGIACRGVGIPDAIASGERAATDVFGRPARD